MILSVLDSLYIYIIPPLPVQLQKFETISEDGEG